MDNSTKDQIISIIDDVDDLTIATVREDGYPQATTVSYVNDGMAIYFGTSAEAQKAKNIARCNKVSLTINRPYKSWSEIESLSIGGRASRVTDPKEEARVGEFMFGKFPQIRDYVDLGDSIGELVLFRIDPEVISLLDYAKGFGHTETMEV